MELYFNEFSIKNGESITRDTIITLTMVYKALLKYSVTTCRIGSEDSNKLFQLISSLPDSMNVKNFYFSFFRSPYESDTVEKNQDDYYKYNWTFNSQACIGFALAYLLGSASLSIYTSGWNIPFVQFFKDRGAEKARNICVEEHVDIHIPQIMDETEAELLKCDLKSQDKKIVLRNDHGMDVLEDFSKRLIRCPYLIGVVNSLPYNPYERKFIKRIRENGLIEIVLPWTDKGYGIVVKTTGRTVRETERISEIIEEEFGYL